mmetsp:Transcript_5726/g.13423  ORF Transcript_5726/g.13423 Transcript_5726/m.13423 type:complete len:168 (-) Transcript_5726:310-813(-)|eukprot:CAMPEP_0206430598 /NCGR_PEP_ID=MMETSP0324_2-20121206/6903_1 /ASSEMBLY_ACC=CAM_ASM_000836 /TAXON_ID=2866 /ORGANISM="Crypthecodinium cohnii, Strain Seligo" /LENGTH=167 /DNA_ID=CAMNT_0053896443 /DNA_START=30 /DNA_END=533 /DNA_ORIENTATION=+
MAQAQSLAKGSLLGRIFGCGTKVQKPHRSSQKDCSDAGIRSKVIAETSVTSKASLVVSQLPSGKEAVSKGTSLASADTTLPKSLTLDQAVASAELLQFDLSLEDAGYSWECQQESDEPMWPYILASQVSRRSSKDSKLCPMFCGPDCCDQGRRCYSKGSQPVIYSYA